MKKLLIILSVIAFTNLTYAQTKADSNAISNSTSINLDSETQNHILKNMINNEELKDMVWSQLRSNAQTSSQFGKLYRENNNSRDMTLKAVANNESLKNSVMTWISSNPDVYSKVMKIIGK